MADQNKIAASLSSEELTEFLDKCWQTKGLTLAKVQELAGGYGIHVSLMGAKTFRDTTFSKHLARIGKANELARQMQELRAAGAGHTIADAAAAILSDEVLDQLVNRDEDSELDLDTLSKIVSRLRSGDAQLAALRHRIEQDQFDASKAAIKYAKELQIIISDKSLNDEVKTARVRQRLFGVKPAGMEDL